MSWLKRITHSSIPAEQVMAPATVESGVAKGLHAGQQDEVEADMLIRYFSKQRDLVIDPCCGTGSTAVTVR